ncbi:MAG: EAL domain-containing protein [Lachnotalea sp.]
MENRGKNNGYAFCLLLIGFVFVICFVHFDKVYASKIEKKNVLFISSYSESFITVPDQLKGLQSVFDNNNVYLQVEYMDTKRFSADENVANFYTSLKYKLENGSKYDAIIVGDDTALQFAMDHQEELFSGLPIIFFGINDIERAEKAVSNPYMTGIIEETSLVDNIQIACKFNSNATKVKAIVDDTLAGQGDQKQFEKASESFLDLEFQTINVSQYSFDEFQSVLEGIGNDTILLFLSMNQDKTEKYMDLDKQFQFIKDYTNVPVYRASVGGVGAGLIGGKMISYEKFGNMAADLVLNVFSGKSINTMKIIENTPYYYFFDYSIIQKYNINPNLIPNGAILINKKINPLEKYLKYIIMIGLLVELLSIVAVVLSIDNLKRRKMQKELQDSHEELTSIYEELSASEEQLKLQYNIVEEHAKKVDLLYEKYEIAITATNGAVWELDVDTKELEISKSMESVVNKTVPESENYYIILKYLVHPKYRKRVVTEFKKYLAGENDEVHIQVLANVEDGKKRWILIRGKGIRENSGNYKKLYGILLDITAMKEQEEYIEYFANHDYLTHLPNRMRFMEVLTRELDMKASGAVLLFDIDDFKSINDTMGHVYGDELLKQIAKRLEIICDERMFAARMGGDEFLVLIKDVTTNKEVDKYVEKIDSAFVEVFSFEGMEDSINFSMGITLFPKDSDNINQLIMNADTAMYKAKRNGKNNCMYYHEDMQNEIRFKKEIDAILRQAMKEDGFCLMYQPQVDAHTGVIVGFEALLRLKGYSLSPAEFIPVAEETGYIIDIGRWVASEAIKQMEEWKNKGLQEKTVAINFSSKQLRDKGYIDYVRQLLSEHKISAEFLEIEITESILLENNIQTMEFLQELKKHGFKIALDDFGTGYSSLNYLTYIPVNKIKLDKSINDKFLEYENSKVMESLISLAHSLNLKITAEGIEDWNKFMKLQRSGCDYIQGYLFSKPLDKQDVEKIYDKHFLEK